MSKPTGVFDPEDILHVLDKHGVRYVMIGALAGYADLSEHAERFEVFGVRVLTASLGDIIRSKQAANRPRDRQDVAELRALKKLH